MYILIPESQCMFLSTYSAINRPALLKVLLAEQSIWTCLRGSSVLAPHLGTLLSGLCHSCPQMSRAPRLGWPSPHPPKNLRSADLSVCHCEDRAAAASVREALPHSPGHGEAAFNSLQSVHLSFPCSCAWPAPSLGAGISTGSRVCKRSRQLLFRAPHRKRRRIAVIKLQSGFFRFKGEIFASLQVHASL